MGKLLPVRQGISAPVVTNIPDQWSAAWFQGFITNFLQYSDTRNAQNSPDVQITGNIDSPATLSTQPFSLASTKTTNTNSTSALLTADPDLQLSFPQTGGYSIEIYLPFYEQNSNVGGFQFDLGFGTAAVSTLSYGVMGFTSAITSQTTSTQILEPSTSASSPTWVLIKGSITITAVGTLGLRWAQITTSSANPTTVLIGAYMIATNLG